MTSIWLDYFLIRKSGLFDSEFYLKNYPDIKVSNIDPLLHYLKIGWKEGRNPSEHFNTTYYLETYRDVKISRMNPLTHYIRHGIKEGRKISPSRYFHEFPSSKRIDNKTEPNFFKILFLQFKLIYIKSIFYIKDYGFFEFIKKIKSKIQFSHINTPQLKNHVSQSTKNPYEIQYFKELSTAKSIKTDKYIEELDQDESDLKREVKYIAFYLPQFHPIPENDLWWGKGFTEWTNVSKAIPQFLGHYQPRIPGELGYYDLRISDVMARQIELAKNYGIFGFCFYFYWFNGKRLLDKPLENLLNDNKLDLPFCLSWANEDWTRRWDGRSDQIIISQEHSFENDSKIIYDLIKFFDDPRYITIDGRPLLILYRANILKEPNKTIDYWKRVALDNGFKEPYILATRTFGYNNPSNDGFEGVIDFPPHNINNLHELSKELDLLNPEYSGIVYRYSDLVDSSIKNISKEEYKKFFTVFPSWDNEARRPGNGLTFMDSTPELYGRWLDHVSRKTIKNFEKEERFVFINAWNEWAEGAYLEPDRRFGYAYLQMTRDVLINLSKPEFKIEVKKNNIINSSFSINKYQRMNKEILTKWPQYSNVGKDIIQHECPKIIDQLFPIVHPKPEVSIIIPVNNNFHDTFNCIKSISLLSDKSSYEVIIMDDNSSDETSFVFSQCNNIIYLKNNVNEGFLKSCNTAARHAKGELIILLNNDTIVLDGWLDYLANTTKINPKVGLVGSKLIYPDGTLQEAGGVIWQDGNALNFGRNDDPNKPEYNYLRNVDYCSGASICIPRKVWEEIEGFDETYSPAYYEDTDLAFRIRERGYEVLFQPFSVVIHLEGKTSGTDITKGIKRYQEINRNKFYDRWKSRIADFGFPSENYFSFRNRKRNKNALVIDVCTPKPDQDSGSIDTYHYLLTLRKLGFEVTFISVVDPELIDKYVKDLQLNGVEVIYQPYLISIENYLKKFARYYDLFLLFRAPYGGKYINQIRKYAPKSKIIFNTVDLHFLREIRENEISGRKSFLMKFLMKNRELNIMKKSNHTILVSEYEKVYLESINPKINASVIPLPREIPGRKNSFSERKHIVFIGGFLHKPNIDAVKYFVKEIWPLITDKLSDCEFWIVGSNVPMEIMMLENEKIKIIGYVENLSEIFDNCKLTVAPLRYGAGVKGKILTSLSYGVPCVATSIATEGMGLKNNYNVMIDDIPMKFANSVIELYSSESMWDKLSTNGMTFMIENYSLEIFKKKVSQLIGNLDFRLDN